ncbi:ornithine cyclodeaminase [Streptosporangium sandarakinum]|uniref:Ornithine cyclodeaminase n=1 Tax=Streptosporangium sandarakinum TaxID=1260955 RepID=A0A852V7I0_9ACTN|nr:ornithine cyclodeaminase family protein [Streptosporangium sandarakinum]NYF44096.1 ornithine cyclodeaminase [Streptosporangium sandarakinum]
MSAPPYLDGPALRELVPMATAVRVLEEALLAGLDPEDGPQRPVVEVPAGQLLLMPAAWGRFTGIKVAGVAPGNPARGLPRICGTYLLMDGETLVPLAVLDGAALTALRTPAVSALAVRHLAAEDAGHLTVFGTGPQAWGHVEALRAVRPLRRVSVVARDPARAEEFAARCAAAGLRADTLPATAPAAGYGAPPGTAPALADPGQSGLVACCTTSRTPLFDGRMIRDGVTVIAVGSHEPDAREIDDDLVARSTVVVEARRAALAEAGDLVIPIRNGTITSGHLAGNLADLVTGAVSPGPGPRVFKSVGMAWEDLVVAGAAYEAWLRARTTR